MPNRWTDYVRKVAEKYNIAYACALANPKVSSGYRQKYPKVVKQPSGRPRGRPRKYATEAEAKKAKYESTMISNHEIFMGRREPRKYERKKPVPRRGKIVEIVNSGPLWL